MSIISHINWTESTWNPVTGCNKFSDGCINCYAERYAVRLRAMGLNKYKNGFKPTIHVDAFDEPLKWKKSRIIFVCSMSDLFHKDIPDEVILNIFNVMNMANWHIFQVLTKRSERLLDLSSKIKWTDNIWMGVTVESSKYLNRINHLKQTNAKVKFLSIEPLLSAIPNLPLTDINWIIVGGESGYKARPVKTEWVIGIKNQCINVSIPFFFKQWGGVNRKATGRELEGRTWDEKPRTLVIEPVMEYNLF
ncbi:MAG: DUF5131 family protein [bacterium]